MADPKALTDAEGEWFELYNATAEVIELKGCTIGDGAEQPRPIAESVRVAAGAYATVARTPEPGFSASVVSALSLKNGADVIEISCGGTLLDRVSYDKAQGFPLGAGVAAALDPAQLDADANDSPGAWCLAADVYAADLGTPGGPNAPCSLEVEDAGTAGEY
jgi:hypothetical protein